MTSTIVPAGLLDRLRLPLGQDKYKTWLNLSLDDGSAENPGILVIGGSRTGKTSLQIMIGALAASRGCIVIILDPKQRFARAFRRPKTHEELPHVLVYWDSDLDRIPAEWHGIMQLVVHDQRLRYNIDGHADVKQLDDLDRFPPVLVIVDEMGRALELADDEWARRKPKDCKDNTPLRDYLHESAAQGGEAHHINCWSNQTGGVNNFPKANTETRSLFGQRIVLGNLSEEEQKRMIFGPGVTVPSVPLGQKGAGNVAWQRNNPMRFQAIYEDWEHHPELVYDLAALGVPTLRKGGHINDSGKLILGGISVPSPGKMLYHVSSSGLDLIPDSDLGDESNDDADESAPVLLRSAPERGEPEEERVDESAPLPATESAQRFITGNDEAAEFCGMEKTTFLKNKRRHPIPNTHEKAQGNKPGWWESDLSEWALYRSQNARKKEAA